MGDVKEVANGYGRNYLFPKGFAILATPGQLKQVDVLQARRAKEDAKRQSEAEALATRLGTLAVSIPVRVGAEDRLFGSVTNADIAAALREQHEVEIDRRDVDLDDPIRTLGEHTVTVRLGGQVQGHLKVNVVKEGETAEPAAATA
jgi:large subunit ribosomal protein L9